MLAPPNSWSCFFVWFQSFPVLQGTYRAKNGWNRCDLFVLWRWWVFFLSVFAGWRCLWTKSSKRIGKDHQLAKREKAGEHGKCREHGRAALEPDVWWIVLVRMFQESSGRMDGIDSRKHSGTTSKFANSNGYSSFWFCYIVVIPSAHTSTIPEPVPQVWDEYSIPSYTY